MNEPLSAKRRPIRDLLGKLQAYRVTNWTPEDYTAELQDRHEVAELADADLVSSIVKGSADPERPKVKVSFEQLLDPGLRSSVQRDAATASKHIVAIDLDVPAYLVDSGTPGHSHLYIDVPMSWGKYKQLMRVLADVGIIEEGYYNVSIARGHSDLRVPWKPKTGVKA